MASENAYMHVQTTTRQPEHANQSLPLELTLTTTVDRIKKELRATTNAFTVKQPLISIPGLITLLATYSIIFANGAVYIV